MFDLFGWVRRGVRQAVLSGLADAVADITGERTEDGGDRLARLLAGPGPVDVTPELPAEQPANGKGRRAKASS